MTLTRGPPESWAFQTRSQKELKLEAPGLPGQRGFGPARASGALRRRPAPGRGSRGRGAAGAPPRGGARRAPSGSPRAGGHSGGRGAMEAPAELLAALPALATALALLLAWLLLRRGAAASSNPAGAPPEPAPPAEAGGTPEPPGPCAAEPAAAPEGPGEPALPDKPTAAPAEAAAAAAEEEEQAAEERQVRSRPPGLPFPPRARFSPRLGAPCRPRPR